MHAPIHRAAGPEQEVQDVQSLEGIFLIITFFLKDFSGLCIIIIMEHLHHPF